MNIVAPKCAKIPEYAPIVAGFSQALNAPIADLLEILTLLKMDAQPVAMHFLKTEKMAPPLKKTKKNGSLMRRIRSLGGYMWFR